MRSSPGRDGRLKARQASWRRGRAAAKVAALLLAAAGLALAVVFTEFAGFKRFAGLQGQKPESRRGVLRPSASGKAVTLPAMPSPLGDLLAAVQAMRQRDTAAMARYYASAASKAPQDSWLAARAYDAALKLGNMDDALAYARILARGTAPPFEARLHVALYAMRAGNAARAVEFLKQPTRLWQQIYAAMSVHAWLLAAEGHTEEALKLAGRLPEMDGFHPRALQQAMLRDMSGMEPQATLALYAEAYRHRGKLDMPRALLYGNYLMRNERFAEAREVYQSMAQSPTLSRAAPLFLRNVAQRRIPQPLVKTPRDGVAFALFEAGLTWLPLRHYDLALAYMRLARDLKPELAAADLMIASLLENMGLYREAAATLEPLLRDPVWRTAAARHIAAYYEKLRRHEDAVGVLEDALTQQPEAMELLVALAYNLRAAGRPERAVAVYTRALEAGGDDREKWRLFYDRGTLFHQLNRWEEAERDLLAAIALKPDVPYLLNYLAYSWVERGEKLDASLDMLARALSFRPEDGQIIDSYGWALYKLERYEEAVAYLEQAVERTPQSAVINDHLGDALLRVGRLYEAEYQWRRALALADDEPVTDGEALHVRIRRKLRQQSRPTPP